MAGVKEKSGEAKVPNSDERDDAQLVYCSPSQTIVTANPALSKL